MKVKSHCGSRERIRKVSRVALKRHLDSKVCLGDLEDSEIFFLLSCAGLVCAGSFSNRLLGPDVACS